MFGAPKSPAYEKLEQGEESQPLHHPTFSPTERSERSWVYLLKLVCKITVCFLASYGIYYAVRDTGVLGGSQSIHNHHVTHGPALQEDGYVTWPDTRSCSCGATVEEAIANGCKFDSHALAWLPPHCRDDELTAEFEKLGPRPDGSWELYATHDRSQPLYFANISLVPGTKFYMTMEWHDMHCAYTWRKLYRSRVLGITMDRKSDGLAHVGHCTKEFLRRAPLQDLTTRATIDLDADHPVKEDEE